MEYTPNWAKTWHFLRGALVDPQPTWEALFEEDKPWQSTAVILTGPLIIGSLVLRGILSWLFSSAYPFSHSMGLTGWLTALLMTLLGFAVFVFVLNFLAGQFKGKVNFNRAFAAASLVAVPAYVGIVIGALPWIGGLISLALSIYTLVLLYRIIPKYLEVPEASRTAHFIVTLLCMFVISMILGFFASMVFKSEHREKYPGSYFDKQESGSPERSSPGIGIFGGIEQAADYSDQAMSDRYEPPRNGELSSNQVETFIDFMQKTRTLREEYGQSVAEVSKKGEDEQDLSSLMTVFNSVANMGMAEMKVVKTGGGNWAEHQWIRKQLDAARIQKDINPEIKHNYKLYQRYEDQLRDLI